MKVEEFFSEGLRLAKPEYWTIFFNFLIYILLIVIAAITVIGLLIVPSLAAGLVRFTIRVGRGEEVDVGDSLSWGFQDGMWLKSLVFCVISFIGIIIGFMLLILPGIYLSVAWFLGFYLLIDKGLTPLEALGRSRELVHEVSFWKVLVILFAMSIGLQFISLIPVLGIVGNVFLWPLVAMVQFAIYEHAIKGDIKGDIKTADADFSED
tara:strand:+ start:357 stop:980 length:624 start_codon:yes stop_codon:yes gene_type:complete